MTASPVSPAASGIEVTKRFGAKLVIRDLNFEIPQGEIVGIIGPSGCGKTTTIRMLLGLLQPTAGELRLLGRPPHRISARERASLGYMPQLFSLSPDLSVWESMQFAASIYGMRWAGRGKIVEQQLEFVDLWEARSTPGAQLSGGMQRRLQLATTLLHHPTFVVLDEPTAGIDPVLRSKFWEHFRRLRDEGRTLIVTTQYVTESEYCDSILVLKDGAIVARGTPDEVRQAALGGEIVHISGPDLARRATDVFDFDVVRIAAKVRAVRPLGDDGLEVVVERASAAVPVLLDALREFDVEVDTIEEPRANFDDVFVRLMSDPNDESAEA